jgi:CRP/FNR family transcriptional regulator, cyclic AMP receptor protein
VRDETRGSSDAGAGESEGFGTVLGPDELDDLRSRGTLKTYNKGAFLMSEGESSDHVLVIQRGHAKVSSFTGTGREMVLAVRGPGELLGDFSALDGGVRSASASALEEVEALVVSADRFRDFLEDHPRLAIFLLQTWSRRVRDADRKRVEYGAYDTPARVAWRLIELCSRYGEPEGDSVRITLSLTQDDLAGWTGSSREAVAKALREFRERGWVTTSRRSILVNDLAALRTRAT